MKKIIFCDFDGTITAKETFVGMLKEFTPELSAEVIPQMYNLTLSLRQGVRKLLESIPSSSYPSILEYAQQAAIRPGLEELLNFASERGIPFVVVSGGLKGMVETTLGTLINKVTAIYAVEVDQSETYLKVNSEFEDGTELVAKVQVIEQYQPEISIAIGDSVTDLNMALYADYVFARDRLAQYLNDRQKPYYEWTDFHDIRFILSDLFFHV